MIIEMNEQEYLDDIKRLYECEMKPLLLKGWSLTRATKFMGIRSGRHNRKYWELRKLALADGYQLRR